MANTVFAAVMHCSPLQPKKLLTLLNKVISNLLTNVLKFPVPGTPVATLQVEVMPLTNTIAAAKGGGLEATAANNKEALKVHGLLKDGLPYINGIAKGDKDTILLSGYDASHEPQPAVIPDAPVIKSIENGPIHGSAKIKLEKTTGQKGKRTYIVEMTLTGDNLNSFHIILFAGSSKKLIIPNLIRGQEVYIRVAAMNAKGQSQYSNVVPFIPQTGASPAPGTGTGTTPPPATA